MGLLHSPLARLGVPLLIFLVFAAGYHPLLASLSPYLNLLYAAPFYLLFTALLLSHLFKSARVGMTVVILLISYTVILTRLQSPLTDGTTYLEYVLLVVLLPINLLYIRITRDRKLTSLFGLLFFAAMALEIGWGALLVMQYGELATWLYQHPVFVRIPAFSPLPLLLIVMLLIALCMAAIRVLHKNSVDDHATFIALTCTSVTVIFFDMAYVSSFSFAIAGLLLIANQVAFSHQLAFLDGLTAIPSRRALQDELKHLGRRYTIAMLDVDHFKRFNDTYGHETGDDVLKLVGSLLSQCEGGATAFRYGGEEFTLLFKGKTTDQCLPFLDALREDIAQYPLVLREENRPTNPNEGKQKRGQKEDTATVHVTVSIGFADASQASQPDEVLQLADQALYKAKQAGRNCIRGSE
ncbi:hypothetical protein BZG84_09945 [Salinivibrio sp. PR932]|uniref:GGDEF domain-containing protein n=2 Tax=unclassified Salinivibrio TaxID=2636825 RepID=UPI0009896B13|nr:GGDEF domain-containing protein [Salinivibrio sp. PR932]OOF16734.1 hypothetical protein BZG84_09945 [Salinivibrio sp. PR932]